jgi:hypothetical protein
MKDVAGVRGTMTMMRVWLLRTLPNETGNAMRAMEGTGIIKTSGIVFSQDSASSIKAQMTKATVPESWCESDGFKHSSQSLIGQVKKRRWRVMKRRRNWRRRRDKITIKER